jgi:hypothetical protein
MMKERMLVRASMFRLIALLVLVTSAFDYCAFDLSDPTAPMSSTRSEAIRDLVVQHKASIKSLISELPDDQCLGCAPSITPGLLILHRASLSTFVAQCAEPAIPSSDRIIPKRPPRA